MKKIVVLGASPKASRYSNKAVKDLVSGAYGEYEVIPVTPKGGEVHGISCHLTLDTVSAGVDTLTLYLGPTGSTAILANVLALKPKRIIFNPGTENELLQAKATAAGIECLEACTLILLHTGQF